MPDLSALARRVFVRAQKILLPACLFAAYFFGVGPTALLLRLLPRRVRPAAGPGTFWKQARPAPAGPADALEQS